MMNHVLMLSLDTALATPSSRRFPSAALTYAARTGRLTIIVYTTPHVGAAFQPSDHLTIIPTNSRHPVLFPLDAIRLARGVLRGGGVNLITTQEPLATGLVGLRLRLRYRVPLLVQNHSYFFGNQAWLDERPLRNRLLTAIGRVVVARADFYRTVNDKEKQNYLAAGDHRAGWSRCH
ncbi:MAG: glycosyltransferase [Chloroflexi bacterium]|uniref:glycosyltransferase family 4 protein n=1 Tax=Candidatus Flexifilum breve TaxID=3140694 RepID=UPI0031357FEB|nr:glycosyltransferase [Chloroflexota bacterium]